VTQYAEEPTIPTRVTLETVSGEEWLPHSATIANLTRHEVWIGIEEPLGELLDPERRVRLVLRRPDGGTQTAETMVLWHIGSDGLVVVLMRPTLWDPPSKRAHSRARLAIPVHLHPDADAPAVPARSTNIGVGGVYCVSEAPVPVGHKLPISLRLTPVKSFDCQAEVVRVDEDTDDPSGGQVVIALRFLDLTEDDQATLASALAALADDVDAESVPRAWRNAEAAAE
jgi:hypothetical protein